MNVLHWLLASVTALAIVVFMALIALADNFRRSFGASENGPLTVAVPFVVMLVLLASLLWPGQRILLHGAAAVVLILAALSLWVLRDSVFVGAAGLSYCGLWYVWYWHTAWARGGTSPL